MHQIFDIRGTHGSGKSTIPRTILEQCDSVVLRGLPFTYEGRIGVLGYYVPELNLYILGKYETACGGCDGIKTQDEIKSRVEHFRKLGHVLLEGILVAHTFGPWLHFSAGLPWHFCFLDTPLSECERRVDARRAEAGKGPLANKGNIIRDYGRIMGLYDKFEAEGRDVTWIQGPTSFMEYFHEKCNS